MKPVRQMMAYLFGRKENALLLNYYTMKIIQKTSLLFALIMLFVACQSVSTAKEILSDASIRKDVMTEIASDTAMAREMMNELMLSPKGMVAMHEHHKVMMQDHTSMTQMMKDNPDMMHSMMTDMMEACKNDSSMMNTMCTKMMNNPEMKEMMKKMMKK